MVCVSLFVVNFWPWQRAHTIFFGRCAFLRIGLTISVWTFRARVFVCHLRVIFVFRFGLLCKVLIEAVRAWVTHDGQLLFVLTPAKPITAWSMLFDAIASKSACIITSVMKPVISSSHLRLLFCFCTDYYTHSNLRLADCIMAKQPNLNFTHPGAVLLF